MHVLSHRHATPEMVEQYLVEYNELVGAYPDFIVGFDMAGQEDKGAPLVDFADVLLQAQEDNPNIKYYFHAGFILGLT
jgi:adenosine deaminase CECR1